MFLTNITNILIIFLKVIFLSFKLCIKRKLFYYLEKESIESKFQFYFCHLNVEFH